MKKLLFILLFIPLTLFSQDEVTSQEKEKPIFKITRKNGEVFRSKSYRINEKNDRIDIQTIDGKIIRFNPKSIASIDEVKKDWDYFEFSEEGFTDYVVVNIESLSKEDLYVQVKNWIKDTYNTPSAVIKSEIEYKKIRIQGTKKNAISHKILLSNFVYDILYSIEISVRDGKYKFDPIGTQYWQNGSKYTSAGYVDISIFNSENLSHYYFQKGSKKGRLRETWRSFPNQLETHFNNLNISLFNYINKNKDNLNDVSDEDDW